jgi:hypothetical protein
VPRHPLRSAALAAAGLVLLLLTGAGRATESEAYDGSRFADVWAAVTSDPYSQLPREKVTAIGILSGGMDNMLAAARRTLVDQADLWPEHRRKLIRPNGICLAGEWRITDAKSSYTGLFAPGARGLVIARASVMSDEVESGQLRSFGLAGKVFPTQDPHAKVRTANFFLIDDNAGTLQPHFTRAELLSRPAVGKVALLKRIARDALAFSAETIKVLGAVKKYQKLADPSGPVGMRQLYPLSRAGLEPGAADRAPQLMKLVAAATPVDQKDFREELRVAHYPCQDGAAGVARSSASCLRFGIFVADSLARHPKWELVGEVLFRADATSLSCDQRLTFHHPRWQ